MGNLVHLYFAAPGSLSDGATASTMIFFSCGVRSRSCDAGVAAAAAAAAGVVAGAALAAGWSAGGDAAQAASATLAAINAIAPPAFVRKVTPFIAANNTNNQRPIAIAPQTPAHFSFGSSALTVSITAGGVW